MAKYHNIEKEMPADAFVTQDMADGVYILVQKGKIEKKKVAGELYSHICQTLQTAPFEPGKWYLPQQVYTAVHKKWPHLRADGSKKSLKDTVFHWHDTAEGRYKNYSKRTSDPDASGLIFRQANDQTWSIRWNSTFFT
jgi:hypothetical protein